MLCLLCMLFFPFRFFHFLSILFLTFPLLLFVLHTFHSFTSPSISLPFFSFHFLFQVFVKPGTGPERPGTLPKNSRTPLLEHLLTGCLPSPYPPNPPPPPPPSTLHYKNLQKITKPKKLVNHQWINKCISSVTGKRRLGQIDKITLLNDFWRF